MGVLAGLVHDGGVYGMQKAGMGVLAGLVDQAEGTQWTGSHLLLGGEHGSHLRAGSPSEGGGGQQGTLLAQ